VTRIESTDRLSRRALILEWATIGWNVGESVLAIALGTVAGSLALIGFGSVSVVEVFASGVVVWHVRRSRHGDDSAGTVRALRMVALAFLALGATLMVAGIRDIVAGRHPDESIWGIAYLAVTAVVMFGLAIAKRSLGARLGSAPLISEARLTFLDGMLSVGTMTGLALNAVLEWWWADPAAGLLVAVAALFEARETWEEAAEMPIGGGGPATAEGAPRNG
jgi:divalent metal cation (Fe/Co/Zn/Cd) transporter